jgi:hypothetical protein
LQQEFGRAFNERNLQQMRQFSLAYPNANALRSELTWTHYRRLMQLPDPEQRAFYERLAATKPDKVAITAVMRKLIVIINAVLASQSPCNYAKLA